MAVLLIFGMVMSLSMQLTNSSSAKGAKEKRVPILCYHILTEQPKSRYDVSMKAFKEQINYLIEKKYDFLTVDELVSGLKQSKLPDRGVVITIDDGDISSYNIAFKIAKENKIHFTFCIYTGRIGKNKNSVSWEQLKEMAEAGMEIVSHSKTHPHLTPPVKKTSWKTLPEQEVKKELEESKSILENKLNKKIKYFTYPYGLYNENVEKLAVLAGYDGMLTLDWGVNRTSTNPLRLKRKMLTSAATLKEFVELLK